MVIIYNNKAYRWSHYSQKGEGGDHYGEGAIHHIIPRQTLQQFWDIIVDYYPDLWEGIVSNILEKVDMVFESADAIYQSVYKKEIFGVEGDQKQEIKDKMTSQIQRAAKIFQDRAFRGMNTTLSDGSNEYKEFSRRMSTVYSWMPGNLVIGPLSEERADDPGPKSEELDAHALIQKWPKKGGVEQYGKFKNLYSQMEDFIGQQNELNEQNEQVNRHKKRRNVTIMKLYRADEEIMKAEEMETKAREIINEIVSLLAGQDITNGTFWEAKKKKAKEKKVKYQSDPIRLFEVHQ